MSSSKKGSQWHFGMKAHIGVDTAHGLVHTVGVTTGKVSDYSMSEALLHGAEVTAHGDRGYADRHREPDRERGEEDVGPRWFVPFKRKKGCDTTPEQKRLNRMLAGLRSAVEHPFRVLKRQFGYVQVRYRGLFKNGQQVFTQFAMVNLYLGEAWWHRPDDRRRGRVPSAPEIASRPEHRTTAARAPPAATGPIHISLCLTLN